MRRVIALFLFACSVVFWPQPTFGSQAPDEVRCIPADVRAEMVAQFLVTEPEYTATFCGTGHTLGEQLSRWLADLTLQAQACGENPFGISGSCWWEPRLAYYDKNGAFLTKTLGSEWWLETEGPELKFYEDIIGEMGVEGSGCLVVSAHIPFFSVIRSYNAAGIDGEYGYALEPSEELVEGTIYQWVINVGGRGNCFTLNPTFSEATLSVTRVLSVDEITKEEEAITWDIPIEPGCRLHKGFQFGDRFVLEGADGVRVGCSSMADGTSDGTAAKPVPLIYSE